MKAIEQRRAANALERTNKLLRKKTELKKRYRAYVDRLGPAIITTGLGQALATECAAAGPGPKRNVAEQAHHELYRNLQQWLCRKDGVYPPDSDLLRAITAQSESRYLHAQAEALAWLDWHKKSCRALLPKDEEDRE